MIPSALHYFALNRPTAIAVSDGKQQLTFDELANRVNAFANWLAEQEISSIGFQLNNGIEWLVCDLASIQANLTIVPIPMFFSKTQISHVIRDANVDLFVQEDPCLFNPASDPEIWETVALPGTTGTTGYRARKRYPGTTKARKITYTSGSTGEPKGVCLDQQAIDRVAVSIFTAMKSIDIRKHLCVLPLATLLENIAGLYAPILKGIEIIIPSSDAIGLSGSSKLDVNQFAQAFGIYRPDSVILVPQLLTALTTLTQLNMIAPSYLKMVAVGGGRISAQLLTRARNIGLPVFEGYGLSECGSVLTLNTPDANKTGSVGRPLEHAQIRIGDDDEIEVKGAVMDCYLGELDNTSNEPDEWFKTGDLGYIDDEGFVFIKGRIKNIFITSFGRNVNPEWVESALTQQVDIAHAILTGEGRDHNLALIWPRFEADHDAIRDLVTQSNDGLPDYAQVHEFILMNDLAEDKLDDNLVTHNGRLKRAEVLGKYQEKIEAHYLKAASQEEILNPSTKGKQHAIL